MIQNTEKHPPVNPDSLDGVVRLVRRICLLREQGNPAEAARLESADLAAALVQSQADAGPGALTPKALEEFYAIERVRIADAAVLAELLVPQLARALAASRTDGRADEPGKPMPATFSSRTAAGGGPAEAPAVSDLLDTMLAHDRAKRRRPAPASRDRLSP